MAEHECIHEADLAVMADNVKDMKSSVEKLVNLIQGNGDDGIKGRVKSAAVQLKIQWGLLMALFGVVVWIIKR